MAETSRGIVTPNQTDRYKLVTDLNTMATSIDEALKDAANTYRGTSSQRTQFTSQAPEGTIWVDTNGEKIVWVKQGVSWRRIWPVRQGDIPGTPYATAVGSVTVSVPSAHTPASATVTFPLGRFTTTPFVFLSALTNNPASIKFMSYESASSAGCAIWVERTGAWNLAVRWQAVQMTPTSAEG